jgi:hypothetical protein
MCKYSATGSGNNMIFFSNENTVVSFSCVYVNFRELAEKEIFVDICIFDSSKY